MPDIKKVGLNAQIDPCAILQSLKIKPLDFILPLLGEINQEPEQIETIVSHLNPEIVVSYMTVHYQDELKDEFEDVIEDDLRTKIEEDLSTDTEFLKESIKNLSTEEKLDLLGIVGEDYFSGLPFQEQLKIIDRCGILKSLFKDLRKELPLTFSK